MGGQVNCQLPSGKKVAGSSQLASLLDLATLEELVVLCCKSYSIYLCNRRLVSYEIQLWKTTMMLSIANDHSTFDIFQHSPPANFFMSEEKRAIF